MKLGLIIPALILAFQPSASRAESHFVIGAGTAITDTNRPDPKDTLISGSVFISHTGTLQVIWDGVAVNGGSYGVSTGDGENYHWNITLPTVVLDLQAIFGVDWMKAIKLNVAAGGYDDDTARNTIDSYIGKITLNLTQSVYASEKLSLEINESAGFAGHFNRHLNETGVDSESVPVYLQLSATAVDHISPSAAIAISVGTYATLYQQINSPDQDRFGAFINPEIRIGQAFTAGMRGEYMERLLFTDETVYQHSIQTSAYVKYVLSSANSDFKHSIQLSVGQVYDESIPVENGQTLDNRYAKMMYNVTF